jgi:hypothetical protein
MKAFETTQLIDPRNKEVYNNGFKVTFENGHTISVQFGRVNYCDEGKTTAEIAAWDANGEWIKITEYDDVKGHCSPSDMLEIMNKISQL